MGSYCFRSAYSDNAPVTARPEPCADANGHQADGHEKQALLFLRAEVAVHSWRSSRFGPHATGRVKALTTFVARLRGVMRMLCAMAQFMKPGM